MVFGKIDLNDALVSPFFVLASGVNADLFDLVLFGVDFSDPIWTHDSGVYVSLATLVAIAAIVVAFATNQPSFSKLQLTETWVAVATIGLVIAPPFVPILRGLIEATAVLGLVAIVIQAGGFYTLSYLG